MVRRTVRFWLGASDWLLLTGCFWLAVSDWLFLTGRSWLGASDWLLLTGCFRLFRHSHFNIKENFSSQPIINTHIHTHTLVLLSFWGPALLAVSYTPHHHGYHNRLHGNLDHHRDTPDFNMKMVLFSSAVCTHSELMSKLTKPGPETKPGPW